MHKIITLALALAFSACLAAPLFAADEYPAVTRAIKNLQDAKDSINAAKADLGPSKAAALAGIDKAIADVKAGLEFAKSQKAGKAADKKADKKTIKAVSPTAK